MNDQTIVGKTVAAPAPAIAQTRAKLSAAFLLGAALVFLVGFAHPQAVHDAAHDTRHSMAFPCH